MNIIHISDIHIKNNSNIDDYKYIFSNIYDIILENKIDVAAITGDLAHTKNQLSPEYFYIASNFLYDISKLVKNVIIILGNHDVAPGRLDAVTPIVSTLNKKNIILLINDHYIIDNVNFINHTCFIKKHDNCLDDIRRHIISDKVNILLYHGLVSGCVLNNLYAYTSDDKFDINQLRDIGIHFGLFGDVHKSQFLTDDKRFVYAGSIMQQNHGEDSDKNVVIYNIVDVNNYNAYFVPIKQRIRFVTLNNKIDLENFLNEKSLNTQYCIRFIGDNTFINYVKTLKFDENVINVKYIVDTCKEQRDIKFNFRNLDSLEEQNNFIDKYVDFVGDKRFIDNKDEIIKLNVKFDNMLDDKKSYNENYNILQYVKWKNFGCYSDGYFDFRKSYFYGIVSENSKGKTTFIDVILYALFGNSTKGNKTLLINNNYDYLETEISVLSNGHDIKVYRYLDRGNTRKLNIEIDGESIDGLKKDLNGLIEKYFGKYDDFMITNCISQFDIHNIIFSMGSKKRMEKIFTDYGFEKLNAKYLIAKNEVSRIKREVNKLISDKRDIAKLELDISNLQSLIDNNKKVVNECDEEISKLQEKLWSSANNININFDYNKYVSTIDKLSDNLCKYKVFKKELYNKFNFNILEDHNNDINDVVDNIVCIRDKISNVKNEINLLNEYGHMSYNYNSFCEKCPLYNKYRDILSKYNLSNDRKKELQNMLDKLVMEEIDIKNIIDKKNKINDYLNKINKIKNDIMLYYNIIVGDLQNYIVYDCNAIKIFNDLKASIENLKNRRDKLIADNNKMLYTLGKLQQEMRVARENQLKIDELTKELSVYELYQELMSPDNLQKEIFNSVIKFINDVIGDIMQQFNFVVKLIVDDDGLNVNIVYADGSTRDINLCSGMEKTMANVVIRLALMKLRTNYNIVIFDETFSYFDGNNVSILPSLFDYIKREGEKGYRTILITHDFRLKDMVDCVVGINYNANTKLSSMYVE